jgi:hypothetical protein
MSNKGHREGTRPGDVEYVIGKGTADGTAAAPGGGFAIAARAYHPPGVLAHAVLQVDVQCSLSHQLRSNTPRLFKSFSATKYFVAGSSSDA